MWPRVAFVRTDVSEAHHLHHQGDKKQLTKNKDNSN
jgi:hypothetical protein